MVRKGRTWFEGAKYHVTSRGIRRSPLFFEEKDYKKYLELLEDTKSTYPFFLHTYCLMTNHTHLQIETVETSLSIIMKNLNTKYAKFFNKKYEFSGHVFEKRYGAELITTPEYEIDVSKYIHLNPVTAGITAAPEDYIWSSYHAYAFGKHSPILYTQTLLSHFPEPASLQYQEYMSSSPLDTFFWKEGKIYFEKEMDLPCGQK
ncbi:putative transposase [Bacillus sp. SLBN-46]|uniref:transposase n=1 Tax=Bacillus sp. SLBN-46 TaxID=3042283 RepID=UPI00286056E3|nr:transposase [Bacillus sp. SLBN-46]MDR6121534.1 putative transposase [Bacillus sp. SLBN-46]